jgi:MoaA/NifB/PqqE/SkfB family radical SAM enzyme
MKRFALREEQFGGTLFDREILLHKFVSHDEISSGSLSMNGNKSIDYDILTTDRSSVPASLIYSPIRVYFELTRACNLRCRTCFNQSGKPLEDELTTEEVLRTLEGLAKDSILDVRFSGGELTQRADWHEILEFSKNTGIATSINTNGIFDSEKTLDQLAGLDLEQVTLSIDGTEQFHDYIRGTGMYQRAMGTLKELHKRKAHLRVNTVLTRGSAEAMPGILESVTPFIEEINFFYMRLAGRALNIQDQTMSFTDMHNFDNAISGLKPKYPGVRILHGSRVIKNNSIGGALHEDFGLRIGGPDGFTRINILPNGEVWPGGYAPHISPEYYLGNIKDFNYSILPIWRESTPLKEFREYSFSVQEKCSSCIEQNVRCPGASVEMELYSRSTGEKNPYCVN